MKTIFGVKLQKLFLHCKGQSREIIFKIVRLRYLISYHATSIKANIDNVIYRELSNNKEKYLYQCNYDCTHITYLHRRVDWPLYNEKYTPNNSAAEFFLRFRKICLYYFFLFRVLLLAQGWFYCRSICIDTQIYPQ